MPCVGDSSSPRGGTQNDRNFAVIASATWSPECAVNPPLRSPSCNGGVLRAAKIQTLSVMGYSIQSHEIVIELSVCVSELLTSATSNSLPYESSLCRKIPKRIRGLAHFTIVLRKVFIKYGQKETGWGFGVCQARRWSLVMSTWCGQSGWSQTLPSNMSNLRPPTTHYVLSDPHQKHASDLHR